MSDLRDVIEARHVAGHKLYLRFDDGVEGVIDFSRRLEFTGVFEPHADAAFFAEVSVEHGTVAWPNDTDMDPDVLWSIVTGKPIPWAEGPLPLQER